MKISFIGAGKVASNLGVLFQAAGHEVKYGVRTPAEDKTSIGEAISFGEVILLAVPYEAVKGLVAEQGHLLKGKIVIDMINPVDLTDWSPLYLGEDSSGEQTARALPESKVVKAFNAIFADIMLPERSSFKGLNATAFIASDDGEAAQIVKGLAENIGFDPVLVKGIKNSRYLEAMANLNISIALQGGGTNAGFIYFQR